VPDERVIQAMERVPRELFLAPGARHLACLNEALPIGQGQTISQPLIVAMMTSALQLTGGERVLEIGAGSGYQAAVLSLLARQVVTVERNTVLARDARERLAALGYRNVTVHESSAVLGWPQDAPYDAVIVTAAAPRVPQSLLDQLGEEGRIVIPVGSRSQQELIVAQKRGGQVQQRSLGGCRFVPLISPDAWDE
jgi:protein-L-isoaspartate(D-aspartate) O-methyltransferase